MIKRTLSLILAISTILLISAVPCSMAYAETAAEVRSSLTSSALTFCELTGQETELADGIYYLTSDLSYTGSDASEAGKSGTPGLKIADGATVYIYIPEGVKLTCTGGRGFDAVPGEDGKEVQTVSSKVTESGIGYTRISYNTQSTAKGGAGATGGGAGIYVPKNASIAVFGEGTLVCTGGNGGNAAAGGSGADTKYSIVSWYSPSAGTAAANLHKEYKTNTGLEEVWEGTAAEATGLYEVGFHPGTGGGAGGAAAGGGAGIGGNGGNGSAGTDGAYEEDLWMNEYVTDIKKASAPSAGKTGDAGKIYLDVATETLTGGNGGAAGTAAPDGKAAETPAGIIYEEDGNQLTEKLFLTHGQPGGAGGAGGKGAAAGAGGAGGKGGTGGDSGSGCDSVFENKTAAYGISSRGAAGTAGAAGTETDTAMTSAEYPYNMAVFICEGSSDSQNYYIKQSSPITVPDCTLEGFVGYTVTKAASELPECFGETPCELTESYSESGKIYRSGDTITADGICGDVEFTAVILTASISGWTYGDTPNEPTVTGNIEEGTISFKYFKDPDCTQPVDPEESGSAVEGGVPVNAGTYYLKAYSEKSGVITESAARAFEIRPKALTEDMLVLSVDGTGTDSAEYESGVSHSVSYSLKDGDTELTEGTDFILDEGKSSRLQQTAIGTYKVTVKGTGNYTGSVTKNWKITNTIITGVVSEGYEGEYDGASHGITVDISGSNVPDATLSYCETETGTFKTTPIEYTDAGEYEVFYKISASGYEYVIGTETVIITPKKVTVTLTADSKYYDGTTDGTEITAAAESGVDGETLSITGITGTFEDKNAGKDKKINVDSSGCTLVVAGGRKKAANYELVIPEETAAEIYKKPIKITAAGTDREYDGTNTVGITGSLPEDSGIIPGDSVTVAGGTGLMKDADVGENKPVNVSNVTLGGADAGNYDVIYPVSATVNITKKDISDGTVILKGPVLTENGAPQTQPVEKIVLPGFENVSWELTDNTETSPGIYTLTVTGTGNYTGSITKTFTIKENNPGAPAGTGVTTSFYNGIITLQVENNPAVPQIKLNTGGNEAESAMAGAEDHSRVADGENLSLKIKTAPRSESDLSEYERGSIRYAIGSKTFAGYMDISLFKKLSGDPAETEYHETYSPLDITLTIPAGMYPKVRTYYIVGYYNGKATLIPSVYNAEAGTLTFKTDEFGVFALCYTSPNGGGGGGSGGNKAAPTGDTGVVLLWASAACAGVAGITFILGRDGRKKRKED